MIAMNVIMIVVMLGMVGAVGYLIYKTIGGMEEGLEEGTQELTNNNLIDMIGLDNVYAMKEETRDQGDLVLDLTNDYAWAKATENIPWWNVTAWGDKIKVFNRGGSDGIAGEISVESNKYSTLKAQDEVFLSAKAEAGDSRSLTNFDFTTYVPFIVGFVLLLFILALAAILKPRSKKVKSVEKQEDVQDVSYREVTPAPQTAPQPIVIEAPTQPAISMQGPTVTDYVIDGERAKTKALALCESKHVTYEEAVAEAGTDDPQKVYQYMLGR